MLEGSEYEMEAAFGWVNTGSDPSLLSVLF
jgi:hypothetical protein